MKSARRLAFVAFTALPLLAQDPQRAQTPQPELGVVHGTVIRAGTGEPIADATLTLSAAPSTAIRDSLKSFVSSVGLPPGEAEAALGQMLRQTPEFVTIQIAQAKATGAPASLVDLLSQVLALKTGTKGFPLLAKSDSNGQFTFSGVPAGAFTLLVHSDDGYFGSGVNRAPHFDHQDVSLPVTVRTLQTTVTVPMTRGAVISGRLRDANGRPAPNVPVSAMEIWYSNGVRTLATGHTVRTDDTGQFRLFWLDPGQYFVTATPPVSTGALTTFYPGSLQPTMDNPITVSEGQEVPGMDFALQTGRTVTVSGEVTEVGADGNPASPRNLRIRLARQPGIGSPVIQGTFPVDINASGRKTAFELRGVPEGTYYLYATTAPNLRSATSVEVRDKDVTGIQVEVHLNITVPGVVTIDGVTPPTNTGVRIALSAFDPDGKTVSDAPSRSEGVPLAPDGKFSVPNNPWGRYATRVIGLPPDSYVDEVQQGGLNVYDSGINVTADAFRAATDQITVKVKTNGGRIEGVVQSADRKRSSGAVVVLVPPVARRRNPALYRVIASDDEGRFALRGIQPGEYKVFAWEKVPEGAWENAEFLSKYDAQTRTISIAPSGSMQLEIIAAR